MKVLFVLEDLRIGGAQRHALALAAALRPTFDCDVLSLSPPTGEPIAIPDDIDVAHLGVRPLWPQAWPILARAISKQRPDLIVTVNPVATLAVAAARRAGGPRALRAVIFHTTRIDRLGARLRIAPFIAATRCCDALVYVSANQRRHWERRGLAARRVQVILNGVATDGADVATATRRASAKAGFGWSGEDFVFGVAAAMRPEKNLGQLVDALAALRRQGAPARLLIVGDGPERRRVEARARDCGVEGSVAITGFQPDVQPFLDALDVGVLPSTAVETLSLFALEAMARGVPMVMSDIGGACEIVTDGHDGRLFPARDTEALVQALCACLDPAERARMSKAAVRTAKLRFDEGRMTAAYAALFEALISGPEACP